MDRAGQQGRKLELLRSRLSRLYPHPPVLIRRALVDDVLPTSNGQKCSVPAGQDILISVYNIHHSEAVWDDPDEFKPERFDMHEALPNESNTSFR